MPSKMKLRLLSALVFTIVLTCSASAHEVTIINESKLRNGSMLKPDTYRLEVVKNQDASEALFYKGSNLVLRTPVTLTAEADKSKRTEVHSEGVDAERVITMIRVQGWKESLVFK
jgi:hypothetical protein